MVVCLYLCWYVPFYELVFALVSHSVTVSVSHNFILLNERGKLRNSTKRDADSPLCILSALQSVSFPFLNWPNISVAETLLVSLSAHLTGCVHCEGDPALADLLLGWRSWKYFVKLSLLNIPITAPHNPTVKLSTVVLATKFPVYSTKPVLRELRFIRKWNVINIRRDDYKRR